MAVQNEVMEFVLGPTVDVAAGTAAKWGRTVGTSGEKYEVLSATLFPDAAITANGTNFSIYTLLNETQSLTITSRTYAATNSVAQTPESLVLTAASKFINGGDVVSWAKAETASGLAGRPRCAVRVRRVL